MTCVSDIGLCVVRGTSFELSVTLTDDWAEVVAAPASYEGRLVFREGDDVNLPVYLTITDTPDAVTDPAPGEAPLIMLFTATPTDTNTLPVGTLSHYCELRTVAGDDITRLFEGECEVTE